MANKVILNCLFVTDQRPLIPNGDPIDSKIAALYQSILRLMEKIISLFSNEK